MLPWLLQREVSPWWLLCGMLLLPLGCGGKSPDKSESIVDKSAPETAEKTAAETMEKTAEEKSQEPPEAIKPPPPVTDNRSVVDDPEDQLQADLDDAINLLEQGHLAVFIERYMPLEYVQNIRQFSTIEQMANNIKQGGLFEKEWLQKLRALKHGEVHFTDADRSEALYSSYLTDENSTPADFNLPDPATEKMLTSKGFSGELPEVITQAIAALEAGKTQEFVENLFPASELPLETWDSQWQAISVRLKEHPQMQERMLADLKALKALTPTYQADNTVAVFQLNAETKQAREIRFEKTGTWRLADSAKQIRQDVYKQSQLPPVSVKRELNTEWIRVRDHWRLSRT